MCGYASPGAAGVSKNVAWQFSGSLLKTVTMLFLIGAGNLLAQQTPPGDQTWPQNNPSPVQYADPQTEQQPDTQPPYPDSDQTFPRDEYGQTQTPAQPLPVQPLPVQPLNAAQLEQLVAPIALYPDRLVAQVLAASTYPSQVSDADDWRRTQGYATQDQIAAGADVQNWDPSVKALTAFPQVLAQMDRNLQWTTDLGNAYYNQPQDVLEAIQVMRQRARQAGNLQSTPQEAVNYDQGYIQLMPANPQVVYVPTYNPWTVYGAQVSPYPGFSLLGAVASFFGSSPINYGLGIAMSAFGHTPWGWLAWGLNWLSQSVLFNHSDYNSHSTTVADWGFRHNGLHAYAGRGAFARRPDSRTSEGYRRFGDGYSRNSGQRFAHTPNTYAGNWRGNASGGQNFRGAYNRAPREAYGRPMQDHRTASSGFQRGESSGRPSGTFASRNFAHPQARPTRSGGLHSFGGGHAPRNVSSHGSSGFHMRGGSRAPKSFHGSGKNFGGGHSHGGGGHSSGHGGGKHHH
jgi:hypothetical protein